MIDYNCSTYICIGCLCHITLLNLSWNCATQKQFSCSFTSSPAVFLGYSHVLVNEFSYLLIWVWFRLIRFVKHLFRPVISHIHQASYFYDIWSSEWNFVGASSYHHEKIIFRIMGWLSKFFKGSSHKISEGHYRGNYWEGPNSNYNAPSSSRVIDLHSFSFLLLFPFALNWHFFEPKFCCIRRTWLR